MRICAVYEDKLDLLLLTSEEMKKVISTQFSRTQEIKTVYLYHESKYSWNNILNSFNDNDPHC